MDYIVHYGVLGMKWGVRRYQNKDGTLTSAGKKHYNKNEDSNLQNENSTTKRKGLTDTQKKVLIAGAAFAATALAAYGGYKLYKAGVFDDAIDAGKTFLSDKGLVVKSSNSGIKDLPSAESVDTVLKSANPTGSHNNCYNVVTATIGRLCGKDVVAKGDTQNDAGLAFTEICKAFGKEADVKRMDSPTVDRIVRQLEKRYSDGDCGAIAVEFNSLYKRSFGISDSSSAAHTFNFVMENGKARLFDSQIGKDDNFMRKFLSSYLSSDKEVSFCKLANTTEGLSEETLNRIAKFVDAK